MATSLCCSYLAGEVPESSLSLIPEVIPFSFRRQRTQNGEDHLLRPSTSDLIILGATESDATHDAAADTAEQDIVASPLTTQASESDDSVQCDPRATDPFMFKVSRRGRWWMPLAAVGLALAPFVLFEFTLRWLVPTQAGAVDFDPYVDLHQLRPLFQFDKEGDLWRIPESRWNYFQPDSFTATKSETTRRIFVLGGSTVQGRPYATETAFSTWLKLRLQAAFPELDFEVINCGGVSYASYRVAKILEEVLSHQPDGIVLYTGHNEFLEDREYADVRSLNRVTGWLSSVASNVRTVSWLQQKWRSPSRPSDSMASEVDTRLDHVGGLEKYHRAPQWRRGVEQHFQETLRRMVLRAKAAGVPLWLCVPASDVVRTPPFKVELAPSLSLAKRDKWAEAWATANDATNDFFQRIAACETCLKIDPDDAAAHYLAGRLRYEQGETGLAKEHLVAARDMDVCPLRATTNIVESVIQVAEQEKVALILTPELLDQRDQRGRRIADGISDPEFFVDHLHPSILGHQRIAAAVAERIQASGLIPGVVAGNQETEVIQQRYADLAELHLQTLGEEYYARGRQRLEGLRLWATGRAGQSISPRSN